MNLSIRNRLAGTVTAVTTGEAMASVGVRLESGPQLTAAVTADAVRDLGLTVGSAVHVLAKSTEVALATGPVDGLSIRNRLPGTVTRLTAGEAMTGVTVDVGGGHLTAVVTNEAVADLGLAPGTAVTALVKATELSLATTG
ncbi:TOBE domain-containing protein [Streptomyces sp. DSM 42041]|uniref:TOBE domain-containing protein n=1 Tax=Streptomyces hazeniae TaxID=3075538 RepID=A0ABU2NMF7_9ACTN|nr:TOBE domain-containing protein [Streptomyces sp. DSM 42041]MDT0377929.1 TOBE domain-containing protein [Streptomyces sp. DSM 42041]